MKKTMLLGMFVIFGIPMFATKIAVQNIQNSPTFNKGFTYVEEEPTQYNLYQQSLIKCFSYNPVNVEKTDRNSIHLSNYL